MEWCKACDVLRCVVLCCTSTRGLQSHMTKPSCRQHHPVHDAEWVPAIPRWAACCHALLRPLGHVFDGFSRMSHALAMPGLICCLLLTDPSGKVCNEELCPGISSNMQRWVLRSVEGRTKDTAHKTAHTAVNTDAVKPFW